MLFDIEDCREFAGENSVVYAFNFEPERESWRALPKELWSFLIDPPGQWIETTPDICIRYGDVPHSAKVRHEAKPLQPNHVYIVFIGARPVSDSTATLGYEAAFCLKLSKDGNNTIEMVPWDKNAQRWHHEVCTP